MISLASAWSIAVIINTCIATDFRTSTDSHLTVADRLRLERIFKLGLKANDLLSIYSSVTGYIHLEKAIPGISEICGLLEESGHNLSLTVEDIHHLGSTWKSLGRCQPKSLPLEEFSKILTTIVEKGNPSIPELYHAVSALKSLNLVVPDAAVSKLTRYVQNSLKKDDSLWNLGYIFHLASELEPLGSHAFNHIEDTILQADEVDGRFLQFDGGLSVTSHLLNGMIKLSTTLKKEIPLTIHQIVKLSNYLLSRKFVESPESALNLISSLKSLTTAGGEKLACIMFADGSSAVSEMQPVVRVRICDLFGRPLTTISTVTLHSVRNVEEGVTVISRKDLQSNLDDTSAYDLDLFSALPKPGFYEIAISTNSAATTLLVNVLTGVRLNSVEIGIVDADQTAQPRLTKTAYPQQLDDKIEADLQQKLMIKFSVVRSMGNELTEVHQSFIRIFSTSDGSRSNEIIFAAEADASQLYKIEMPVSTAAKTFNYQSGNYTVELIIGDYFLDDAIRWTLATLSLKFSEPPVPNSEITPISKRRTRGHSSKLEIKHLFREPVRRPSTMISNFFTGLCLSPILILIFLLLKLRVDLKISSTSLNAVVFHLGIGSIFLLFGTFWLKLDMFITLRYLLGLGLVTFLSGNRLLAQTAIVRKATL